GIQNKIALISASSTGLGREVALVLAEEGAKVIICSRSSNKLRAAANYIKENAQKEVRFEPCDLTKRSEIENLVSLVIKDFGNIDILINNSGGPKSGYFSDFTDRDWLEAFNLNFLSTQILTSLVIPHMKKNNFGRIVNITSISAKQPIDGLILSNGIRAGILGMAKTLANELAPYQILVNNVCPGYTLTERVKTLSETLAKNKNTTPEHIIKEWESSIPLNRLGTPREFANLVAFLCSNSASYITGTTIQCDGGAVKSIF
ncbi:MAG: SDR family oxidoreductase, partial [Spirochaetota bacterium]|nr:SDR family oxidoreductase [Spirochaetota bacterium]